MIDRIAALGELYSKTKTVIPTLMYGDLHNSNLLYERNARSNKLNIRVFNFNALEKVRSKEALTELHLATIRLQRKPFENTFFSLSL